MSQLNTHTRVSADNIFLYIMTVWLIFELNNDIPNLSLISSNTTLSVQSNSKLSQNGWKSTSMLQYK